MSNSFARKHLTEAFREQIETNVGEDPEVLAEILATRALELLDPEVEEDIEYRDHPDNPELMHAISYVPGHEGYIVIPRKMTAKQFNDWWIQMNKKTKEKLHPMFETFPAAVSLVVEWHLEAIDPDTDFGNNGLDLPSPNIAFFLTRAVAPIVRAATDPKLSRVRSTKA
jgi:hypothetical protein